VDRVSDFGQDEQVVATEGGRAAPLTLVAAIEALEGDVVPRIRFALVSPDRGLDAADGSSNLS
jgi:hypothetical protein